jgi:hypothetical protein
MTAPTTLPLAGNTGGFCLQPTVEVAQRWPWRYESETFVKSTLAGAELFI